MGKVFFAIVAAVASLALAEALICNKCTFNLFGTCVNQMNETCSTNASVCFTSRTTFPSLPDFMGFNLQGCRDNNMTCGSTASDTLLGATYNTTTTCCTADNCNPVVITSGAPAARLTFVSAAAAAVLVSAWGSIL